MRENRYAAWNGDDTAPRAPLTYRITARQWLAIDVAAAVLGMLVITFGLRVMHGPRFDLPTPGMAVVTVAATLPVALRRLTPLPVFVLVAAAIAVLTAVGRDPLPCDVMLGMAAYMAGLRLARTAAVLAIVAAEAAIGAGLLAAAATTHAQNIYLHSMLAAAAMWFVGTGVRERRAYRAGLAEQETQRRRAEAERNQHALQQERLRIARELHDVLAHSLSVVTMQAGIGRRVGAARPAEALRALRAVEEASRGSLDELRRLLCLLRSDDEPAEGGIASPAAALAPAPGLSDLGSLAALVRGAGTPVVLDLTGDVAAVPPATALTAYRIVQEALTNVVRHAPGSAATVLIGIGAAGVRIRVTNTGPPRRPDGTAGRTAADQAGAASLTSHDGTAGHETHGTAGHGIMGMRERVAIFDGTLEAGPLPGGGFRVAAFLPLPTAKTVATTETAPAITPATTTKPVLTAEAAPNIVAGRVA